MGLWPTWWEWADNIKVKTAKVPGLKAWDFVFGSCQVGQNPLRQAPTGGGNAQTGESLGLIWVHSSFSTSDFFNWKTSVAT